ncbi:putative GTP-binding protein EngB [Porphyridium purpureum]|uniref:Putative GTP-binding protein EngB n=1 Tax=Porphyridium purpureum TaxID=35688 RepID=A0A5J4YW34_PORPP|nr:putative GTP-binding protein EngB [Porphyridium purpureum]|eukprot:POR7033..scf227_4
MTDAGRAAMQGALHVRQRQVPCVVQLRRFGKYVISQFDLVELEEEREELRRKALDAAKRMKQGLTEGVPYSERPSPEPKTANRGVNVKLRNMPVDEPSLNLIRALRVSRFGHKGLAPFPHLVMQGHTREVWKDGAYYAYSFKPPEDAETNYPIERELELHDWNVLKQPPDNSLPEIAFLGRSNVGKSSLLNRMAGNGRRLANYDYRPGTTRHVSRYEMASKRFAILDVPGYGFAFGGIAWWKAALDLLMMRPTVNRLIMILDARHGLMNADREVLRAISVRKPNSTLQVVLNKCDLVAEKELAQRSHMVLQETKEYPMCMKRLFFSSAAKNTGVLDLMKYIADTFSANSESSKVEKKKKDKNDEKNRPERKDKYQILQVREQPPSSSSSSRIRK